MNFAYFSKDFLASIVVFLVALPLCLGIAIASGVPPAAGLITGMVGGIVAGSLAGSPLQVSGPAAGLAVFTFQLVQTYGIAALGPLVLVGGLIQLLSGALKLGQVFRAISPAVIYGMLAGIGVLIFGAQFHVMVDDAPRSNGFQNLIAIPQSIMKAVAPEEGKSHHLAALVGISTLLVLILWSRFVPKRLKLIPGALVAVVSAVAISAIFKFPIQYITLPDNLVASIRWTSFSELGQITDPTFLVNAITIAFVASAETLLCAAAVDQLHNGPRTNYDRELTAQGVGNIVCGFAGALPMTGVIVRSSANVQAGAQTRLSAILHGVWMVALVLAFPSVLRMVPTASLAAILVYTGYKLVSPANIRRLATYGPLPVAIYFITLAMIVATDMLTGILVGLGLSLVKLVYALTHLGIRVQRNEQARRVDLYLSGAATFVRLPKFADALESVPVDFEAHVHFRDLGYIDHACADVLKGWELQRTERGQTIVLEWNELMAKYKNGNTFRRGSESEKRDAALVA